MKDFVIGAAMAIVLGLGACSPEERAYTTRCIEKCATMQMGVRRIDYPTKRCVCDARYVVVHP